MLTLIQRHRDHTGRVTFYLMREDSALTGLPIFYGGTEADCRRYLERVASGLAYDGYSVQHGQNRISATPPMQTVPTVSENQVYSFLGCPVLPEDREE